MNAETLIMLYGYNHHAVKTNLEGLSHEDCLVQPEPGGNCMNWVLGHIVATRNQILKQLGKDPIWSENKTAVYDRGSEPITDRARALSLEEILGDLEKSQDSIVAGLKGMTERDLEAPAGDKTAGVKTVGQWLAFLQFHEAYHVGQTALLRRIAGREGAIK